MSIDGLKSYYQQNKNPYSVADEESCELLLRKSFKIMEKTGLEIQSPKAAELLRANGCQVDGCRVRFPEAIVKAAIASAAQELVLYKRGGQEAMRVGGLSNYYGPGPTNPFVEDFETGQRREPRKADVGLSATVVDACPNLDFLMGLANIMDCPVTIADVAEAHEALKHTTKPSVLWAVDCQGLQDIFDMCSAVAGSWEQFLARPFACIFAGCPQTPLILPELICDKLLYSIEKGAPTLVMTGPQLGAVAPVTLAGAVALGLAELLAMLVLAQLTRRGSVLVMGVVILTMDMKTTRSAYGSPEHCLAEALQSDIFHYLNLPHVGTAGVTESKMVDEQAAVESTMQILTNALSGANMVHDVGFMDGAMSGSLEQLVLCDEIISFAKHIRRGINFDEASFALDLIDQIGPGGQYISAPHTCKHFKKELWRPSLLDRSLYESWVEGGRQDMRRRIRAKTAQILAQHRCEPLSPEVEAQLDAIWLRARQRAGEA